MTAGYEPANLIHVFSLNSLQPHYKVSVITLFLQSGYISCLGTYKYQVTVLRNNPRLMWLESLMTLDLPSK